jgi:hypothetical protein
MDKLVVKHGVSFTEQQSEWTTSNAIFISLKLHVAIPIWTSQRDETD